MLKDKRRKYFKVLFFSILTVIFVIITLMSFYSKIREREFLLKVNSMKDLSVQGSAIVENKLVGFVNTLSSAAQFIGQGDLHTEENMNKLYRMVEEEQLDFQRIGLADIQGNSKVTSGAELNISQQDYFKQCMNGANVITESKDSAIVNENIFIVAVPVRNEEEAIKGVLYGIVETESFHIYEDTSLDTESQYIHIIDVNGTYILKDRGANHIIEDNNIFDGLSQMKSEISVPQIIERIKNGKSVLTEVEKGEDERIIYFFPLEMNDWYIVTIMKKSDITESIKYLLDNDVYILMIQVMGAVSLLGAVLLYYSSKEKKTVLELNEQLKFNDEIFRLASAKADFDIMIYNIKNRQLRFIHNSLISVQLPAVIEDAPNHLLDYIPQTKETAEQVAYIFNSIGHDRESRDFNISFVSSGERKHFRIQITNLSNDRDELVQCVGLIKDVTEEMQLKKEVKLREQEELRLREEADIDHLTGLYNRRSGIEKIEKFLKRIEPQERHACMIIDLDNFKNLNDTLGHLMGDQALRDVAQIMHRHFRTYDIVCRLGGDEFVIFLRDIPEDVIERNVKSLLKKLRIKYNDNLHSVSISASAGVALVPMHGIVFKELYRKADLALYEAKQEGKDGFKIYEERKI